MMDRLHTIEKELEALETLKIKIIALEKENWDLRNLFPEILKNINSGFCSPECSMEFLKNIPD